MLNEISTEFTQPSRDLLSTNNSISTTYNNDGTNDHLSDRSSDTRQCQKTYNKTNEDYDIKIIVNEKLCNVGIMKPTSWKIIDLLDNSGAIYYDKDLDDTPYYILKKYENKQKSMVSEMFVDYLSENLIQKQKKNY